MQYYCSTIAVLLQYYCSTIAVLLQYYCSTIAVPSVDEFIKKIESVGGKIFVPKTTVPGIGYYAYFRDTEGNTLGIAQPDPSAK